MSTTIGVPVWLLHGCGYQRNISFRRLLNHAQLGRRFAFQAPSEERPDVIFSAMPTIEISWAAARYAQRNSVPLVIDIRDLWPEVLAAALPGGARGPGKFLLIPYEMLLRGALRRAAAITAISESYLAWALNKAGRERRPDDRVFPHAYESPAGGDRAQEFDPFAVYSIPRSRYIAWFVGTLGKTYDLETVIEAGRRLSKNGCRSFQVVISGDGDKRSELQRRAAGLDWVTFTGRIGSLEIHGLLKNAAIGLAAYAPGAPQSIPNKLIEYMAGGLPVISSLAGEASELLDKEQCGLPYVAGDCESLGDAMRRLLQDDELRSSMGRRARLVFEKHYEAQRVYGAMADHLETVGRMSS
jgi:glycosyltransferase involved in cell wall biosynthesis